MLFQDPEFMANTIQSNFSLMIIWASLGLIRKATEDNNNSITNYISKTHLLCMSELR